MAMGSRVENTTRFFSDPDLYLTKNHRVRLRSLIVKDLAGEIEGCRILDLGCGDGSISAQFLPAKNLVTMVDLSAGMLERAKCGETKLCSRA